MEPGPLRDRVSDLYHRALRCTPDERDAFLEEACAGDAALRREVESLLRFESESARFLETPAAVVPGDFAGAPDESQMIGRQFGPYTLVAPLGAGGMGEVYRARDSKLPRDVAIKILPSHFTADAERRARFAREACLLATVNNPHIGAIYGLEEANGVTALVLELVEGPTLADRLARGPLPIAEALTVGRQIAEALDAAHEKSIVHRDLKPANIVLQSTSNAAGVPSGETRAKVLDFGLAKALSVAGQVDATHGHTESQAGTVDGRVLGTPAYMSPEQARGQAVDKRTDVWAFGCVLFEMLSGTRTFDGDTVSDTFVRVLEHEPDWGALPAATPRPILTLLERCLRKDPRRRLHDIADALIEIDDDARLTGATAPAAPVPPPTDSVWTRERLAWIVSAALGVVLVGVVLNHIRTTPPPSPVVMEFTIAPADGSSFTGLAPQFAISPDGQHFAFAASSKGVPMVWIRSLDTAALRSLPGTDGAAQPFWSPDSRSVGFFARGQLKTVLVSGGSPAVLCDVIGRIGSGLPSGTWNRDDMIVFARGGPFPLQRIKTGSDRGQAVPVTTLSEGDTAHHWPWFLPDGEHFLYMAQRASTNELRVGSLASGPTASLGSFESHVVYAADHIFFVRGGNLMARPFDATTRQPTGAALTLAAQTGVDSPKRGMFSVADTGTLAYSQTARTPSELTWLDRGGKPQSTVGDPRVVYNLALSPDERQLAAAQFTQQPGAQPHTDIWLIDLDRAGAGTRLTDDPAWEFDPAWSPGGDRVVFISNRPEPGKSAYNLFARASDGSGKDELLVKSEESLGRPDWSRDGRFLAYEKGLDGVVDLWTVQINAAQPQVFLATPQHVEYSPAFSPDGRWIAYESNSSGRNEVYVLPFPERGGPFPISRNGGWSPQWRGDGRELIFLSLDGSMMSAGIDTTRGLTALPPTRLFTTDLRPGSAHSYAVTKDGQRFLIPIATQGGPITLVSNWRAKLGH